MAAWRTRRPRRVAAMGSLVTLTALTMQIGCIGAATADDEDDELTRITFDERATQPVDGLRVDGVRFGFRVGGERSTDAVFNAFGPGDTRFISDPSLEGDAAGVLTLRCPDETDVLRFGVALSFFECVIKNAATVRLFDDDGERIRTVRLSTRPLVSFSEARFGFVQYDDVSRAVIRFNSRRADRFVMDNLIFEGDDESSDHDDHDDDAARSAHVGGGGR